MLTFTEIEKNYGEYERVKDSAIRSFIVGIGHLVLTQAGEHEDRRGTFQHHRTSVLKWGHRRTI
jgi:hypothetical protein